MATMPPNPFRKTLATQTEFTAQGHQNLSRNSRPSSPVSSGTRLRYDIDSFTKLLLTGEKNNSNPIASPLSLIPDSSSNTDASSISRQSIFEPLPENHQDTPRTSHEGSTSDDERQVAESAGPGSGSKMKPTTPEHRHVRVATGNIPEAASSNNPALFIPASTVSLAAPNKYSTPTSPRTPTDLNKPLPLPPNVERPHQEAYTARIDTSHQQQASTAGIDMSHRQEGPQPDYQQPHVSRSPSTRIRPTPPATRRYSQLRSETLTRNPEQWTSISEEKIRELDDSPPPLSPSGLKLLPPPPPPPPRRHGRTRGLSASSSNSGVSIATAPPTTSPNDDTVSVSSKPRPPVPPARTPSMSSFKRPTRIATKPNSPSLAPPPAPPPRRRGSSQSSLTPPRPSGEYTIASADRSRADSGSSMMLPSPSTALQPESGKKDVMADLSALQREVDELRRQFKD